MNIFKASFSSLPLEIMKLLIVASLNFTASSKWSENTLASILLVVTSMIIYLFLSWFFQFRRAIKLKFELKNSKTDKNETEVHEDTKEKERTIKLKLSSDRRISILWRFGFWIIKNKQVFLKISSTSDETVLTPKQKSLLTEIHEEVDGFKVNITDLLTRQLKITSAHPHQKRYEFVINMKRGIDITPEREVSIHTDIWIGNKKAGPIFKLFFDVENASHKIGIFPS